MDFLTNVIDYIRSKQYVWFGHAGYISLPKVLK